MSCVTCECTLLDAVTRAGECYHICPGTCLSPEKYARDATTFDTICRGGLLETKWTVMTVEVHNASTVLYNLNGFSLISVLLYARVVTLNPPC